MEEDLKQLQKKEALERLNILHKQYNLMYNVVTEFEKEDVIYYSEYMNKNMQGILYWLSNEERYVNAVKEFEEKHQALVYHAILVPMEFGLTLSLLYVSPHTEEWETDKRELKEGIFCAYCKNLDDDTTSEFGCIQIVGKNGRNKQNSLERSSIMENENDIREIYNKVQQSKTVSPEYMQILHQFNIDREKFDKEITEQQRQDLVELLEKMKQMSSIENEEYFIEGYKRGANLMIQILTNKNGE